MMSKYHKHSEKERFHTFVTAPLFNTQVTLAPFIANIRFLRELMELDGLVCVIMTLTHLLR